MTARRCCSNSIRCGVCHATGTGNLFAVPGFFPDHGKDPKRVERDFFVLDRQSLLDQTRTMIVAGAPDHSRLVQRIEDDSMPPEEDEVCLPRVSEAERLVLRKWIAAGAPPFPDDQDKPLPPPPPSSALADEVKQIFVKHCYECHRFTEAKGGVKIMNYPLLVSKRRVVVPGQPDRSEVHQLLVIADEKKRMPPAPYPRLQPSEIDTVRCWIAAGAPPFPKWDALPPGFNPTLLVPSTVSGQAMGLLRKHCQECHRPGNAQAGILILDHGLLVGKRKGVISGQPDRSRVMQLITAPANTKHMPPRPRPRLVPAEIDILRRWIAEGQRRFPKVPDGKCGALEWFTD